MGLELLLYCLIKEKFSEVLLDQNWGKKILIWDIFDKLHNSYRISNLNYFVDLHLTDQQYLFPLSLLLFDFLILTTL